MPFNFDNLKTFLVLENSIINENVPFINALNNGINNPNTGLIFTLSPSWTQANINKNLTTINNKGIDKQKLINKAKNFTCPTISKDDLTNLPAPKTFPTPTTLTQQVTFNNLTVDKKQTGSQSECKGASYCANLNKITCQSYIACNWISKPTYEYTVTGQGEGDPIVVFNHPLVQNITNSIVSGDTSLFKMLLPDFASPPKERTIDAPQSTFTATSPYPNSSVTVTTSDGSDNMPIYRKTALIQDSLCELQSQWLIPSKLQHTNCSISPTPTPISSICFAPQPYSPELDQLLSQAKSKFNNGAIHHVPDAILKAIYVIEGFSFYTSSNPTCTKNAYSALGLMQVTDSAYNWVVSSGQQPPYQENNCNEIPNMLNRCYAVDIFEIASRVLLVKAGMWDFSNFQPLGTLSDKDDIYNAVWAYYGSRKPDTLTINASQNAIDRGFIQTSQLKGGSINNMGYADLVCALAKLCPPYP